MEMPEAFFPAHTILQIAEATLEGEIALAEGDSVAAVDQFETAVRLQDALPYMEPPYWFNSARLDLGRAHLAADQPAEAAEVFEVDLVEYPENGWALHGLQASLAAQGHHLAAEDTGARFDAAWHDDGIDVGALHRAW